MIFSYLIDILISRNEISKSDRHVVDTDLSCSAPTEDNSRADEHQGDNVEPNQAV